MKTKDIFLNKDSIAIDFIYQYEYPYQILPNIKEYIINLGKSLSSDYIQKENDIWIHKSAKISKNAEINRPGIIDKLAEIRQRIYTKKED